MPISAGYPRTFRRLVLTLSLLPILSACASADSPVADARIDRQPSATATQTLIPLLPPVTATVTPSPVPTTPPTPTYDPGDAASMLEAGNRAYASGSLVDALNAYSLAIRADHGFAEAYYRRGVAYTDFGDLDAALEDLKTALNLDPRYVPALAARAEVWRQLGEYDSALADADLAAALDPTYGPLYLVRGKAYAELDQLDRALQNLDAAVVALPNQPDPYTSRAGVLLRVGNPSAALIDLNVALSIAPSDPETLYIRGKTYELLGQAQRAIADFESASDLGLVSHDLLLDMGRLYLSLGRIAEAEEVLSRAVTLNAADPELHYWYGLASFAAGSYEQAVESASVVLAYQPESLEALSLRATANLYRGYLSPARADFETAYELDSTYVEALIGIAETYIRQGNTAAAVDALNTYLREAPADAPSRAAAEAVVTALTSPEKPTVVPSSLDVQPTSP